jgi:TRAP-type C4-dicarboxylate transport system permease small subunit
MSNLNNPVSEERSNKPEDDEDAPSWGGVISGLFLLIGGIALIFYRYNQFNSTGDEKISITRVEMLIYKATGGSIWGLIAVYALIALVGLFLAVSNYTKMRAK